MVLALFPLVNQTQAAETSIEQGLFILVQTTVRNSDGTILTYLESTKFSDLNLDQLDNFLDFEASRANDPIITLNGQEYQFIRRAQTSTFTSDDLVASTLLSDTKDGQTTLLARFAHDGYPVKNGDILESIWTFIRPVS